MLSPLRYVYLITLWTTAIKAANKKIYFTASDVDFNRHYIRDFRLDIEAGKESLNVIYDVVKNFDQDHWMELIFSTKNRRTGKYKKLVQVNSNACEMLRKQGSNLLATFTRNFWKGKYPGCPLPKGNYTWLAMTASDLHLPPFFDGEYQAYLDLHFRKKSVREFITNLTLSLEVK